MTWIAVSEITRAHGKQQSLTRITRTITTVAVMSGGAAIAAPPAANQLPTGGQISAGVAAIMNNGNTMTVTQSSNRAAINWNTFDIGSQARVNFVQPSSNAVALNRVNSPNPSQIFGQLSSNGQIYLLNSAGVYFAPGAQVNVGGIVATTHAMSDAAFMAGSTTFSRNGSTGKVINEGTIQTSLNGYIAMLAPEVRNTGLLVAQSGTVALAAGESITLNFGPSSKLESLTVTGGQLDALVENRHAIKAPNGLVILSARAMNQLAASVINSGTIEAKGISQRGGRILLEGSSVTNTGTLDVSSDSMEAGTIQINGKNVSISGRVIATSPVQGGAINVQATQSLNVAGTIDASSTGRGGQVRLTASQVAIADGVINADGDTRGGVVEVTATAAQSTNPFSDPFNPPNIPLTVALTGYTGISSRSRRGQGGSATILGDSITLDGNTNINVSGATGGGNVLVGGDWQGSNGTYQATTVLMTENVSIDASATENGNGGKVVLWSDIRKFNGWTNACGSIYAQGGVHGGDGGQIETSGHELGIGGIRTNTLAIAGNSGTWLLDPYNYVINQTVAQTIGNSINGQTNVTTSQYVPSDGAQDQGNPNQAGDITINYCISSIRQGALNLFADGNITFNAGISFTGGVGSNTAFSARANKNIIVNDNVNINTTGSTTLWSNYGNAGGFIDLRSGASINSGYGGIELGGGSNFSTGYATGSSDLTMTNGIYLRGSNTLSSNGWDIKLRGQGSNTNQSVLSVGVVLNGSVLNAGSGNISITGVGLGSGYSNSQAVWIDASSKLMSSSTSSQAISIFADSSGTNNPSVSIGLNYSGLIEATGSNGGISITGIGAAGTVTSVGAGVDGSILARSGNISITGRNTSSTGEALTIRSGLSIGYQTGTNVTGSSSNITLTSDLLAFNGATNINTTGALTIQSNGTSFANAFSTNSNLILDSGLAGLTIGGTDNAVNVNLNNAISIAGPITVYGSTIYQNASLTATRGGADILLKARNNIVVSSYNMTTSGGNITLWSNSNNSTGYINFIDGNSNITSNGGNIILGGGSDINTGYATGTSDVFFTYGMWFKNSTINSGGGNITLRGKSSNVSTSNLDAGIVLEHSNLIAGAGKVYVEGVALGSGGANVQGLNTNNITITTENTSADAINLVGNTSSVSSTHSILAINLGATTLRATGAGGGIILNGTGGSGTGAVYEHGVDIGGSNFLTASGPISIISSKSNSGGSTNYKNLNLFGSNFFGTNNASASTANVTIRADALVVDGGTTNINTAGTFTIESLSDSFTGAFSYPLSGLTVNTSVSGLTIGKSTNSQNVTIASATSIAGPIAVYGSNISLNADLTTTNATTGNISLTGNISGASNIALANARTLTVNQSGSSTYSGCISGTTAALTKAGAGTLTLTGANTYNGTTTISTGTLQVGNGTANGSIANTASIVNNGTLTFNSSDAVTLSQAISGTGNLSTVGSNITTITGAATYTGTTNVTNGSIVFTNNATPSTSGFIGNGTVTITPNGSAFTSAPTLNYTYATTLGGLTVGNATSTTNTNLTVNSTINISGPISLYGGNMVINSNLTTSNATIGNILLKGSSNITQNAGIKVSTNGSSAIYWGDSDGNGVGFILINGTSANFANITTNGGGVWFGGGNGSSTWTPYSGATALTVGNASAAALLAGVSGIQIAYANVTTDAGSISLSGKSFQTNYNVAASNFGVLFTNATLNTTSGDIQVAGTLTGNYSVGGAVQLNNGSALQSTGTGNITLTGNTSDTGGGATNSRNGIAHYGLIKSNSGNISFTGINTSLRTGTDSAGVIFYGGSRTVSQTGNISIVGNNSATGYYDDGIRFQNENSPITIGYDGTNAYSGNILIQSDRIGQRLSSTNSGTAINVQTAGNLSILSSNNSFTRLQVENTNATTGATLNFSDWNFGTSLKSFTLGKSTNTFNLTFNNSLSVDGSIAMYGGNISLGADLTTTNATTGNVDLIGNVSGAANIALASSRTLTVNQSGSSTYSGCISGTSATLTKAGTGTLTLAGTNTYSGSTNVTAGTLQIGNGTANGSVNGSSAVNISSGGNLTINRSDNVTLANAISGAGNLSTVGSNITTITGAATYTGTTNVTNGSIVFTNNATPSTSGFIGNGTVTITPNGSAFTSAPTLNYTYATTLGGLTVGNATSTTNTNLTVNSTINISGPISLYGGNISLLGGLQSAGAGSAILTKAVGTISTDPALTFQTNNGSLTFWSNANGGADGGVTFGNNITLNTANGSSSQTTGGGDITIGGGLNAGNTPTGCATGTSTIGITLGASTSNTTIKSGGGNVSILGASTANSGVFINGNLDIKSGQGAVTINGTAGNGLAGLHFGLSTTSGTTGLLIESSKTTGTAISISGTSNYATTYGVVLIGDASKYLMATGGGDISVTGIGGTSGRPGLYLQNANFLATTGSINLNGGTQGMTLMGDSNTFGQLAGTNVTSSSSNITLAGDSFFAGSPINFNSSGALVIQSNASNFSSAFTTTNMSFGTSLTSLTIGRSTETQNITINSGYGANISGPITIYGGNITLDADLATTNATTGNVDLTGNVSGAANIALASSRTLTVNQSGSSTYSGCISGTSATLTKAGTGTLTITGAATYTGTTNITNGSIVFTNNATPSTSGFIGNGTVTITPNGSAFASAPTLNYTYATTLGGLTVGNATSTTNTNLTVNSTINISGPISLYGGNISLRGGLQSAGAGSAVLAKAIGSISVVAAQTFQTNNGSLTFWSNANGGTTGGVSFGNNVTLNTANGNAAQTTGGGDITIGGGSNAGTVPTGYATGSTGVGVLFGSDLNSTTTIKSGGANVTIQGCSTASSGVYAYGNLDIRSGQGAVTINGTAGGGLAGVNFGQGTANATNALTIESSKASGTAISISGVSSSANTYGVVFNWNGAKYLMATGGGNISVSGTGGSNVVGVFSQNANFLASTGAIVLNGGAKGISFTGASNTFGQLSGTNVTSSSANVTLTGDVITANAPVTFNTSGALVIQSNASNFSSAFTTTNMSFGTSLTSLMIGQSTETQNITIASGYGANVAGPITIYGANVTLNDGLTTTNATTGNVDLTGNVSGAANIALASSRTLTVNQSGSSTYSGCISGTSATLSKAGTGTLTLAGTNTYSGSTNVTAGALQIGNGTANGSVNATSAVNISSGGNLTINRRDNVTLANAISGTGNLSTVGSNITTITGAATYTGTTNVTNGSIVFTNNATPATSGFIGNGTVTIAPNGSAFTSAPTLNYTYATTLGGLTVGNATSTTNTNLTVNSTINISGPISLYGGNISVGADLTTTNATTGNVDLIGNVSGAANIALASSRTLTVNQSGSSTYSGCISGTSATLTKAGTGSLTLSGTSTYGGNTTIAGGTLGISSDANLGTAPSIATAGSIVLNGGTLQATANMTLNANRGISLGTSNGSFSVDPTITLNYAGIIAGTGGMTKSGSGTLALFGANTYSGSTNITAGFLQIGDGLSNGSISATSGITNNAGLIFYRNDAVTFDADIGGTGYVRQAGNITGTLALTGTNTYSGQTQVWSGNLQIGSGGTAGSINSTSDIYVATTAAFVVNRSDNITLPNNIANYNANYSGKFSAIGSGVTTLTGNLTYTGTTNVTNGSIVFTNNATPSTSGFIGNGTVTITPNGSAFTSAPTLNYTYATTLGGLTVGNATSTTNTDLTVNSTINISGPISLYGGNMTVNGSLETTAANADILIKGSGNISLTASKSVTANGSDITFWANSNSASNGTGTGAISLGSAAILRSNGGNIVLAGGQDANSDGTPDGYARGVGVAGIATTGIFTIESGYGSVIMRGSSDTATGVSLSTSASGSAITSTSGLIDIAGISGCTTIISNYSGVGVGTSGTGNITVESASGLVSIDGQGARYGVGFGITTAGADDAGTITIVKSGNTTSNAIVINGYGSSLSPHGITFRGSSNRIYATAAGGGITINASVPNNASWASSVYKPLEILAVSAQINWLNSNSGSGTYFNLNPSITIGSKAGVTGLTTSSSDFTFYVKQFGGTPNFAIGTTGNVTIQGVNGTADFGQAFNSSSFGFNANSQTMSNLVFGSAANTQNVTINSNLITNGSIEIYGGNVSVNSSLTSGSSGLIKLKANSGAITQGASGAITTAGLALLGGNATLTNANNNVTTLAAQNMGNLSYVNAGNLTVGVVNPTGISATGLVNITVQSGNISVTEAITTTSNSSSAIILSAGSTTAAGTATGGNILISGNGSVTTGSAGRATLFTGSVANSTGLTDLVGSGSGRFRYNSNATTNGYNVTAAPLGTGMYAIYREQPTLTISTANASIVYGNTVNTTISAVTVNGDTLAQILGGAPTVTVSGNTSTAGFYVAGNHTANISGAAASIIGYAAPTYSNGTIEIAKADLTVTGTQVANATYSNSTAATFSNNGSLVGVLSNGSFSDVVNLSTSGNFSSRNVGTNLAVTMSDSISGADAANYNLTQPSSIVGNITPKTVTLSASKTYDGTTNLTGAVTIVTGVTGETLTYTNAVANSSHVADNASNYISTITLGNQSGANSTSGGLAANYQLPTLNHTNTPVNIDVANITLTAAGNISKVYSGNTSATVGSGNYTISGLVAGDSLTLNNLSLAAFNNATVSGANSVSVSNLTLAGITGNHSSAITDYSLQTTGLIWGNGGQANTSASITTASLTITANSASTQYGLGTTLGTAAFTSSGLVNNETIGGVTLASNGSAVTANVGSYNITAASATGGNFSASNYNIGYVNGSLSVTAAPITLTASSLSRAYGAANPITDTVTVTSGSLYNGNAVGNATVSTTATATTAAGQTANLTPSAITFTNGSASNYNITYANASLSITQAALTITANNASTQYGLGTTLGTTAFTSSGLANGETIGGVTLVSSGSTATANVGNYSIAASNPTGGSFTASNYNISYVNGSLSVTVAPLGISATGLYSGTTAISPATYSITGLMNGETINTINSLSVSNANVAPNTYITGLVVGNGTANMANYQITQAYNATPNTTTTNALVMIPAPLTVTADNAAKFIGQGLPGSYNVSYSGFVNGQNTGTSGITIGTVSNSANSSSGAGTYALTPTGFSSTNYNISYVNGVYTVTPADTLMVQAGSHTAGYGTTASLTPTSVQYYVNGTGVVPLTYVSNSGNTYIYNDNYGGSVTFTLSPVNAAISSSNNLKANSYQITGGNLTQGGTMNLVGAGVYTGNLVITQRALTASTTNVSKVYDGNTAMVGVNISLSPVVSGDIVSTAGTGAFNQVNVGSNIGYNVSGLMLDGADARNYYLTGGASFTGSNGVISQRTVTLSANQVYSGSAVLTNVTIGNLVGSESLTYSANAISKNVQDNGSNYIANMTLGNGTNGGLGSNYQLPVLNVTNAPVNITRLNSVTWTGGSTGDWFDPVNWAGGAVPDLNNVANVVVPSGASVIFNNNITSPAQAGPVSIDSLAGAGGNLAQQIGTLNVGSGGVTLNNLTLSGGNFTSQGIVNLTAFNQSGGNATVQGNIEVTNYTQSSGNTQTAGSLNASNVSLSGGATTVQGNLLVNGVYDQVGGQVSVTGTSNISTNGSITLGNLVVGGLLNANSASGNITQTSGTVMSITGRASFNALLGTVSLGSNNLFAGGVTINDMNSSRNNNGDGDGNQAKVPVDLWVFQQYAVLGGTPIYVSIPKLQISKNEKLSNAFAFNKEVDLVSENFFVIPDEYVSLDVVTLDESLGAATNESPLPKQPGEVSKLQQERLKTLSPSGFMPVVFSPNKSN